MSRGNPRKAMAALLPLPIDCVDGQTVRPMTLGMWAALERIGSPLVTGEAPADALELLPSLYLLTHDPREVLRGDLLDAAIAWADALPVTALAAIREACDRQSRAVFDVVPEAQKKTTGGTTAGSRHGTTTPQASTDGATKTSCGGSRYRRSRS
ncbi:MAG: hypothetical protein IJ983_03160 [Kiritimatiellae bacterium]|nr:hypothetical protein [Kiritimatiellia bacterium]